MHEIRSTEPPAAPDATPPAPPLSASAHTAAPAPTRARVASAPPPVGAVGPSRLRPFLAFATISATLFLTAAILRGQRVPAVAELGDYCCLGACLSGVAAAIFGCATLVRAVRRRRG